MLYNQKQSGFIKTLRTALLVFTIGFLSSCQSLRPSAELEYTSGLVVDSLSTNVSLSYTTSDRSISGSGYLMYLKPDRMRVVILSPFGSVLQEVYVSGDLVTIIDAGNGIAFSGTQTDLPEKGDFSGWRHINWIIDIDPLNPSQGSAVIERINKFGKAENATFEKGLLISKSTLAGGLVRYGKYTAVKGVPLPLEITYETATKEKFGILLDDPEINVSLAESVFKPNLSNIHVYPLSSLK